MQQFTHNNHYIPQMYLQNWVTDNKICVYRLLVSHEKVPLWTKQSIEHTGSQDNLYTRIEDGIKYDDFEVDFNTLYETPAKKPLEKVISGEKLSPDEWTILIDYVLAQYVRTPAFQQFVNKNGERIFSESFEEVRNSLRDAEIWPNDDSIQTEGSSLLPLKLSITDFKPDDNHTVVKAETVIGKNIWLFAIKHILSEKSEVNAFVKKMKWSIVRANDGSTWPTCDNPILFTSIDIPDFFYTNKKLTRKQRVLLFPLSPKIALIANQRRIFPWQFEADKETTEIIKRSIVNNALLFIYSNYEDQEIPQLRERTVNLEEYKSVEQEFKEWFKKYEEVEAPLLKKR